MRSLSARLIASALAISLFILPAGLSAKERRGAKIVVTRLDGSTAQGELVAVKPDTLILLTSDAKDVSVVLVEIKNIRILRRSKAVEGMFWGLWAGEVGGAIWGGTTASEEWGVAGGAALGVMLVAVPAGLVGLLAGIGAGVDDRINLAGVPEADVAKFWEKLRASSREGSLRPAVQKPRAVGPGPSPAVQTAPPHRPRFRLSIGAAMPVGAFSSSHRHRESTFRFPEEASSEAGPYPYTVSQRSRPIVIGDGIGEASDFFGWGPIGLAYEWKDNWLVEFELFVHGRSDSETFGALRFTSSVDGQAYWGIYQRYYQARFTDLLVGIVYRPVAPQVLQRRSLEIGLAAGPSLVSSVNSPYVVDELPQVHKTVLCGRIRAAWDYYFAPSFSLGAFAEYRYVRTRAPATVDLDNLTFYPDHLNWTEAIVRSTEVSVPAFHIEGSSLFIGLRIGFRI